MDWLCSSKNTYIPQKLFVPYYKSLKLYYCVWLLGSQSFSLLFLLPHSSSPLKSNFGITFIPKVAQVKLCQSIKMQILQALWNLCAGPSPELISPFSCLLGFAFCHYCNHLLKLCCTTFLVAMGGRFRVHFKKLSVGTFAQEFWELSKLKNTEEAWLFFFFCDI